ncbi:flagellar biosynthesis protein FlhB [Gordoniibacillus kamchatkensis]|uniref:Flagellar biosynthetic protein FlhB n=1 Tax=Gordoniibacillus kamchatkensis TaxID=1590651 RepID=A0ABR5AE60_9BACL|nr:flagellar biosynthesis protein FlhB [Paenibacillus sp. VKM B-2647]KIL39261.1 flagellar biosynthesis protein FlhB [Paenibacillus sp. VKM B-2647]
MFAGEKTEKATPKKRGEARNKGQVPKSQEIIGAFVLLFTFLILGVYGLTFHSRLQAMMGTLLEHDLTMAVTSENVRALFLRLSVQGLWLLTPIFLVTIVIAFAGNYFQVGFLFILEPLKPKFSKLNPIEGAKRMFTIRTLVDFLKSVIKMAIIGSVIYMTLWGERAHLMELSRAPLQSSFAYVASLVFSLGVKIGVTLVILGAFDLFYQRYEHEKSLKMSKQDVKDEHKNAEGNPQIKGKIREKQRRLALQRMMQEVPKADVVITNPTHFAVALQYEAGKMEAPTVIAKGADYVALKIREVANANNIMTMENKPLARALYSQVEIGQTIPAELFQAVAEVLAYVYKIKGRTKANA